VIAAAAELIHHEGISRASIPEIDDVKRFWKRWRTRLPADDPFINPNLSVQKNDWSVDPEVVATLKGRIRHKMVFRADGLDQ
jgi:hypothetical protein